MAENYNEECPSDGVRTGKETEEGRALAWRASFPENKEITVDQRTPNEGLRKASEENAATMGTLAHPPKRFVGYFSMEIALENAMPSYSGGLGVLAGDTIRAAADIRLPMVAVSLLYRKGYFRQRLSDDGTQTEEPVEWEVDKFLQ